MLNSQAVAVLLLFLGSGALASSASTVMPRDVLAIWLPFAAAASIVLTIALIIVGIQLHTSRRKIRHLQVQLGIKSEALNRLSKVDAVTDLHNTSHMSELMEIERRRAVRYGVACSLVLLEVDNWPALSKQLDADMASRVMQSFADTLKASVRFSDTVGRWYDDRFVIVCTHTDLAGVRSLARTLHGSLSGEYWTEQGQLTCSMGYVTLQNEETVEAWLNRAELALQRAQNRGAQQIEEGQLSSDQGTS